MQFGFRNVPATLQGEINTILQPLLRMELLIDTKIYTDEYEGIIVITFIDDILIATKGSLEQYHKQVSMVFQLLMDNNICVKIDKCIFDATDETFL